LSTGTLITSPIQGAFVIVIRVDLLSLKRVHKVCAPVAHSDRASAFSWQIVARRSLYRESKPVKWTALYRGSLNSYVLTTGIG
jgi:hypothetical protein